MSIKVTVELDEDEIKGKITEIIAKEARNSYTTFRFEEKKAVEAAVKEVVYSQKDELIERCVDRASTELAKKALPKLLDKMAKAGDA